MPFTFSKSQKLKTKSLDSEIYFCISEKTNYQPRIIWLKVKSIRKDKPAICFNLTKKSLNQLQIAINKKQPWKKTTKEWISSSHKI